jgi:hypothetical protein
MSYKIVKGNLLEVEFPKDRRIIIPHVINDIGHWGAGFSGQLSKKYPKARETIKLLHDKPKLGTTYYTHLLGEEPKIIIASMCAQTGTKDNPKTQDRPPIRYGALAKCMNYTMHVIGLFGTNFRDTEIHAPMFGSGLAGGSWPIIEQMIKEIWSDKGLDVTIYKL